METDKKKEKKGLRSLRVLSDFVAVRLDPREEVTPGGIVIPDAVQEKGIWGRVVATGPEVGDLEPLDHKALVPENAGHAVDWGGQEFVILREGQVLARKEGV